MAYKEVKKYHIGWRHSDHTGTIKMFFAGSGEATAGALPYEDFWAMVDILRNEAPVYYDAAAKVLATHHEPVGEGERT